MEPDASVQQVSEELLASRGLRIVQVWDETQYIESSIDLVQQSLIIGGILAIFILLMFLRSRSSTLIVAVAIPISIVGTFLMMKAFGRTLNVISLAGMAFAVGMVGGVAVPVSTFATPEERDYVLRHSDAAVLLLQPSLLARNYRDELTDGHPEIARGVPGRIRCPALAIASE